MNLRLKAFDLAAESTKELIGLSTGILALTATFSKDVLGGSVGNISKALLVAGWIMFLASIICGILVLQMFAGLFHDAHESEVPQFGGRAVRCAFMQNVCFALGILVVVVFSVGKLWAAP